MSVTYIVIALAVLLLIAAIVVVCVLRSKKSEDASACIPPVLYKPEGTSVCVPPVLYQPDDKVIQVNETSNTDECGSVLPPADSYVVVDTLVGQAEFVNAPAAEAVVDEVPPSIDNVKPKRIRVAKPKADAKKAKETKKATVKKPTKVKATVAVREKSAVKAKAVKTTKTEKTAVKRGRKAKTK